MNPISI